MPGAGFKDFTVGEVLASTDVDRYLMQQAIMRFASAAARDAALPSPSEGMHAYHDDSDLVRFYTGAAWVPVSGQLIAESHLSTTASTVDFQSIPQDFSHLLVVWSARSDRAAISDNMNMFFNNDTTVANYSRQRLIADDTTLTGSRSADAVASVVSAASSATNVFAGGQIVIPDYTDVSRRQIATIHAHYDAGGGAVWNAIAYRWATTAAVNRLTFDLTNGDFIADTMFSLYGLR